MLPHQGAIIQSPLLFPELRYHFLVGGYGCGKTSSLAYSWLKYVSMLQGKKSKEGHKPRVLLGGVTLGHLVKTTLAYIKELLEQSNTDFIHDKKDNRLIVGDVTTILVPLSAPESIMGFDACCALADEIDDLGSVARSDDVTFEAVKAVNERCRQIIPGFRKPFLSFFSTAQGQKGLYRVITNFRKSGTGFNLIRGRTIDNTYLDQDYVKSLFKIYSPDERRVFLEGEFVALAQGRVLGDFDWEKNFVKVAMDREVSQEETIYWAQDFNQGYHRGCAAVVRGNIIYIIKDYEFPDIREAPKVLRFDFPRNKILWIPDTTAKDEIKTFTRELHKHGIWWITRGKNPNVEDSAFITNKLLYCQRLIFTEAAVDTASDCSLAVRDKNGAIPKGVGKLSVIHRVDGVRMLCYFITVTQRAFLDIKRATVERHLAYEEDEPAVTEMSNGYVSINPSAL